MKKIIPRIIVAASLILLLNGFTVRAYVQPNDKTFNYSIKKGDTLAFLSTRFNSSVGKILELNPGLKSQNFIVGRRIKITAGDGVMIHFVKYGDSLWKISKKHDSTIMSIAKKNYVQNPDLIYVGDVLSIPMTGHDKKPMMHDDKKHMEHKDKKPMMHDDKKHMEHKDKKPMMHDDKKHMEHQDKQPMMHDDKKPMEQPENKPMKHDKNKLME
jgi:LysM repeat protein